MGTRMTHMYVRCVRCTQHACVACVDWRGREPERAQHESNDFSHGMCDAPAVAKSPSESRILPSCESAVATM